MGELASESSLVVFGVGEGSVLVAVLILTWVEFSTIALSGVSASLAMFEKESCFFSGLPLHPPINKDNPVTMFACEKFMQTWRNEQVKTSYPFICKPLTSQYLIRILHST